jgi:hypothetical protein
MSGTSNYAGLSFDMKNDVFKVRDEEMCNRFKEQIIDYRDMSVKTYKNVYGDFVVKGDLQGDYPTGAFIKYFAPAPTNYGISFSGSGLPFPNRKMAYEGTPNRGMVPFNGGHYEFKIQYPNSYYDNMGTVLVKPEVQVVVVDEKGNPMSKFYRIPLGDQVGYRSLTFTEKRNWNNGPMFYCNNNLPQRTQEQILKASAYVKKEHPNFWGMMPPH